MTDPTRDVLAECLETIVATWPPPASEREYRRDFRDRQRIADEVLARLAARGYTLSFQPEAAGEAGLRAALTELIQTWRERASTSFHAHAWSDAVTELEAALSEPALPE